MLYMHLAHANPGISSAAPWTLSQCFVACSEPSPFVDPVAEDPAKAIEDKLNLDAATSKALAKEEKAEATDAVSEQDAAKVSIVKTAAEVTTLAYMLQPYCAE